jgi:hypothetical protein
MVGDTSLLLRVAAPRASATAAAAALPSAECCSASPRTVSGSAGTYGASTSGSSWCTRARGAPSTRHACGAPTGRQRRPDAPPGLPAVRHVARSVGASGSAPRSRRAPRYQGLPALLSPRPAHGLFRAARPPASQVRSWRLTRLTACWHVGPRCWPPYPAVGAARRREGPR